MVPALQVYDVLVVSSHDTFSQVTVGDVIVFTKPTDPDRVIVHRVASITNEDPKIVRTKGDANPASIPNTDFPITDKEYIGKVAYVVPHAGYVTQILKPPVNYIIFVVVIASICAKYFVFDKQESKSK